jgi:hypothetical protein
MTDLLPTKESRTIATWSGVAAGLCIALPSVVEAVAGETGPTSLVIALSPALALPLLVGLHRKQGGNEAAFTLNLVGLGLFGGAAFCLNVVLFYLAEPVLPTSTKIAFLGSAAVFALGTILFGVTMLRARIHPRVPVIGYMVAFPVLAVAARLPDTALTSVVHVVAGASLVWLALSL